MSTAAAETAPAPNAPAAIPDSHSSGGGAGKIVLPVILSVLALVLAGTAVGLSVLPSHAGPAGANGAVGPQGPTGTAGARGPSGTNGSLGAPGPGAVLNQTVLNSTGFVVNNTTCNHWPRAQVGFTVSKAGTLMVSATFYARMYHFLNSGDFGEFAIGNRTTDCTTSAEWAVTPGTAPTGVYSESLSLTHIFPVRAAGQYTIYLNGINYGTDELIMFNANIDGVFYPS